MERHIIDLSKPIAGIIATPDIISYIREEPLFVPRNILGVPPEPDYNRFDIAGSRFIGIACSDINNVKSSDFTVITECPVNADFPDFPDMPLPGQLLSTLIPYFFKSSVWYNNDKVVWGSILENSENNFIFLREFVEEHIEVSDGDDVFKVSGAFRKKSPSSSLEASGRALTPSEVKLYSVIPKPAFMDLLRILAKG